MTDLAKAAIEWVKQEPQMIDLTLRQIAILGIVADEAGDRHRVRIIAERLGLSRSIVSRALTNLSDRGFVIRNPVVNDARDCFFTAAKAGKRTRQRMRELQSE